MKTWFAAMAMATTLSLAPGVLAQDAPRQIPLTVGKLGDTFAYRYTMRMSIEQQMGERTLEPQSLGYRYYLDFTVRQIDDAGNTELVMRMRPGSVIVSDGAGEEMRRTQLTIPVPPTARADEGDAQALNNLSTAIDQTQVFFTVTPKGDVQNVHGLERVMEAFGQLEQSDVRLLGPIAPGQIEQTLESIFGAEGAAGTSRRVGAGWQTTRTVDVPPVAVFDFTDDVMLDSINGPVATLVSKGTVGVRRPTVEDAARPALGVEAFSSTTTTQWNLEDGRSVARVSDMVMETRWQLAEVDLLQKQTVHVAIARPE